MIVLTYFHSNLINKNDDIHINHPAHTLTHNVYFYQDQCWNPSAENYLNFHDDTSNMNIYFDVDVNIIVRIIWDATAYKECEQKQAQTWTHVSTFNTICTYQVERQYGKLLQNKWRFQF